MTGFLDLNGPEFLQLYTMLFAIALVAGFAIPRWLRPEGQEQRVDKADDAAFLAGGHGRLAETAAIRMMQAGALRLDGPNALRPGQRSAASSPLDAAIYAQLPSSWASIIRVVKTQADPIARRLTANGLIMDTTMAASLRWWQTAPYVVLFLFGAVRWLSGMSHAKPVGYLTMLLILTAITGAIRFALHDQRTKGGQRAISAMQKYETRLKRAPTEPEMDRAVALYGTGVLIASSYGALHTKRSANDGGGGGCTSSSGDSGGGCGGGCGGCGG